MCTPILIVPLSRLHRQGARFVPRLRESGVFEALIPMAEEAFLRLQVVSYFQPRCHHGKNFRQILAADRRPVISSDDAGTLNT
jgi:hypothetical protein